MSGRVGGARGAVEHISIIARETEKADSLFPGLVNVLELGVDLRAGGKGGSLKVGNDVIGMHTLDIAATPAERAAARGIAQAIEGSNAIKVATPGPGGPMGDDAGRIVFTFDDGRQTSMTDVNGSPDHPDDLPLKAAFDRYQEATGFLNEEALLGKLEQASGIHDTPF